MPRFTLALALLIAPSAGAQVLLGVSFGENIRVAGTEHADQQVLGQTGPSAYLNDIAALTGALPPQANLDAIDYITTSRIYLSLEENVRLSGVEYADEDVILWDGVAFSMAWDGSASGLPARVNLDAIDVIAEAPLEFTFSLGETAVLTGPGQVEDEDLVRWSGAAFAAALDLDGSAEGIPSRADLDAFSRTELDTWAISLDAIASPDGILADDGDLIAFNSTTTAFTGLHFDASAEGIPAAADLDATEANQSQVPVTLSVFTTD